LFAYLHNSLKSKNSWTVKMP